MDRGLTELQNGRRRAERAWHAVRSLYALFWISTGALMLWTLGTGRANPIVQPTPAAQDFADAMDRWPALVVAMASLWIAAGALMLVRRSAPLGLALVAPAVFVILLFHLSLSGQYAWGTFVAAYTLALLWRERAAYASLWNPPPRAGSPADARRAASGV